jgi:hypothetical protein
MSATGAPSGDQTRTLPADGPLAIQPSSAMATVWTLPEWAVTVQATASA